MAAILSWILNETGIDCAMTLLLRYNMSETMIFPSAVLYTWDLVSGYGTNDSHYNITLRMERPGVAFRREQKMWWVCRSLFTSIDDLRLERG